MIILVGPSASGKTEIAKLLISNYGFKKFITTTTRSMRKNEVNHIDYHFVSYEQFLKEKENDMFIETVSYNDNYYGTYKSEISNNKVLIVEPIGLDSFKLMNNNTIVSFFIDCDEDIRKERMLLRGEDLINIKKRITLDRERFNYKIKDKTDFIIENKGKLSLESITKQIYELYLNKIKA